jgi:hypothetical protein
MITGDQIIAHFVGDYVLQSDWMVKEKGRQWLAALVHVIFYALPFLFLTTNPVTLAVIAGTHMIIDRYRLARHVVWIKNYPWPGRKPWSECKKTGFPPDVPNYLSTWLMIIVDNIIHIVINGLAIAYIG